MFHSKGQAPLIGAEGRQNISGVNPQLGNFGPCSSRGQKVPKIRAYCFCSFLPSLALDVPGFCHRVSASNDNNGLATLESTVSPGKVDGFRVVPLERPASGVCRSAGGSYE